MRARKTGCGKADRGQRIIHPAASVLPMLAILVHLIGCIGPDRHDAVPSDQTAKAEIPGVPGARYYIPDGVERWIEDTLESARRAAAADAAAGLSAEDSERHYLAVSGGGDKGAFGAGLLCGWTDAGTRPEFAVVTGISTGALISPFAFLGSDYDDVLREVYTNIGPDDILDRRFLLTAALFNDAMADSDPLRGLIERHVTAGLLERIAAEYERGRWLLVVTTDLDSRRPVVWNMGQIAHTGSPEALILFQQVLLASASIPGAFPPVMLDVEVEGERYQEMHVDGGAVAQTFLFPPTYATTLMSHHRLAERDRFVYVIRNARMDPKWAAVERRTLSILGRSTSTMIQSQGYGDLIRIHRVAEMIDADFNLAIIPPDFDFEHREEFDTAYMRALFDRAYEMAIKGYPWMKQPPGFAVAEPEPSPGAQRKAAGQR